MTTYKRKTPYTEAGIKRLPCLRCGAQASYQWQICADGNTWRPICTLCDVLLNAIVISWAGFSDAEDRIAAYAAEKGVTTSQLSVHITTSAPKIGAENTTRLRQLLGMLEDNPAAKLAQLRDEWRDAGTSGSAIVGFMSRGVIMGIEESAQALGITLPGPAIADLGKQPDPGIDYRGGMISEAYTPKLGKPGEVIMTQAEIERRIPKEPPTRKR